MTEITFETIKRNMLQTGQCHSLRFHFIIIPVVSVHCDFKKTLRYGDKLIVETEYMPDEAAKLRFNYTIYNMTSEKVATGYSVQVFLTKDDSVLQLNNPPFFENWKRANGFL